jgi:hypothetical protein
MSNMFLKLGAVALLFWPTLTCAYEVVNHADMSQASFRLWHGQESTVTTPFGSRGKLFRLGLKQYADLLDERQDKFPKSGPSTASCPFTDATYHALNLIRYGACYEDNAEAGAYRPFAHFYDPQHGGRGLTFGAQVGPSSPDWALKSETSGALTGTNHLSYASARQAFYSALTRREASFTAEQNSQLRREDWGITFQAIGHVIHHLQDMAQPQHVRNDQHCDGTTAPCGPINNTSDYEKYAQSNADLVRSLAATATAPMVFGLPREFWSLQGDSITGYYPPDQGLAAYTSSQYVSAGTNFQFERYGNTAYAVRAPGYSYPVPTPAVTESASVFTLLGDTGLALRGQIESHCPPPNYCKVLFHGTTAQPNTRKAALSIYAYELNASTSPPTPTGVYRAGFTQNRWTHDAALSDLIPKAVSYSAGLINYFFRGEMEISLPSEGVYGLLDHAVEKTKGADGFRLIKMKVKNTTADINTALGSTAQHMSAGEFRAVAKFHRNTCYHPQLTGQIGTISKGDGTVLQTNTVELCRSATEEIVVSSVEPNVAELAAGVTVPMVFDFPNAIPIEATDLTIQVVFKGTLGAEVGAVAVTTRDISEPTFFTYANTNDYRLTPTGAILPYTDENSLAYASSYFSGLGGWMGFARNDAAIRIAKLPEAGLRAGTFSRIALLADTQQPVVPGQVGDASSEWFVGGTLVYQPNLAPLGPADVPVWSFVGESTVAPSCKLAHLQDGSEGPCSYLRRISATRMQQTEDGTYGTLPTYWSMRGLVLAYDQNRTGNQNFLSALVERRFTAQPPSNAETAMSTRLNDYPIFVSLDPVPMAEIKFARAAANRITMSDAAWAAERLQQSPVCAWLGYEQYCKQIIWHPAGVVSE